MKNITVIGVGYVGLVTGTCFADLGNRVVALDINAQRIENLKRGILPIYEPGLKEIIERNVKAERLRFTTDYADALREAEFVFICVGTPEGVDGEADLQYVRMAAESIAQVMDHEMIIVNKSTVPVGTGDWVANIVREHQPRPIPFSVVSCPEFLREAPPCATSSTRIELCWARPTRKPPTKWRSSTCPCALQSSSPTCAPPR